MNFLRLLRRLNHFLQLLRVPGQEKNVRVDHLVFGPALRPRYL